MISLPSLVFTLTNASQLVIIAFLFNGLDRLAGSEYQQLRVILNDQLSPIPATIRTLLSIWLVITLVYLIPAVYRLLSHMPSSRRSKRMTTNTTVFGSSLLLLAAWMKSLLAVYVGWFIVTESQALSTAVDRLAFDHLQAEEWKRNELLLIKSLYPMFTALIVACFGLVVEQNFCFYAIGQATCIAE